MWRQSHQQKRDAARTDIPKNWAVSKMWCSTDIYILKNRIRRSMAMGSKSLCQQKCDTARTDIPQNWDVSKNVTQHGQIYPKTGPSAKTWRSTDRHTPKLGRQQKCDASRTDIAQNRAAGRLQKQSRQQKHERREGRVQKTEQNFRVFRWRVLI